MIETLHSRSQSTKLETRDDYGSDLAHRLRSQSQVAVSSSSRNAFHIAGPKFTVCGHKRARDHRGMGNDDSVNDIDMGSAECMNPIVLVEGSLECFLDEGSDGRQLGARDLVCGRHNQFDSHITNFPQGRAVAPSREKFG